MGTPCWGTPYRIRMRTAKRIELGTAKRIGLGTAKRIAEASRWLTVVAALLVALLVVSTAGEARSAEVGSRRPPGDAREMRRRTDMERLAELVRLHRLGTGARETARLLGMGPNTERQYREAIEAAGLLAGDANALPALEELKAAVSAASPSTLPPQQVSSVAGWAEQIGAWREKGMGPRAIYDRLRIEHPGFPGSYASVKRLCRALEKTRGVRPEDVAIPVETEPGDVAQVDFGYVGKLLDPNEHVLRKAWCFVLVLAHSRQMVVRVVFDQRVETWLRLHIEAFQELGGVPRTLVPDNLKAAVVRAAFSVDAPSELHRSYRELARHYGFKVDPTPPFAPEKKGKVEAGVKYVKHNFFAGRAREDADEVRAHLRRWCDEVAATRVHGTTGKRPVDVFRDREKPALLPLPARPYEPVLWKKARVHRDSHVAFERRLYSVPWRYMGQDVWLRVTPTEVVVRANDERVATHDRRGTDLRSTVSAHLPDHRGDLRHRSRSHWEERAARIGEAVSAFVATIFDADDVLSQLRVVQAIVTHLEAFPPERACAACDRAAHFGNFGFAAVKRILREGHDLLPLDPAGAANGGAGRFARPAASWKEVRRDVH
jgi:transposase